MRIQNRSALWQRRLGAGERERGRPGTRGAAEADLSADAARFAAERLGLVPDAPQAKLLRSRGHRVLLNCTRQWGKSTVTAVKAVHRAYFVEGSLVLVVSPSARQTAEFMRKAEGFLKKLGIAPKGDGDNEISAALPNGSRLVGVPGREETVRGFSAVSLMLIDEAARVRDEMYMAVRPMLAVADGDLWLMSTPWGKRGFFWEAWANGGPEWERVSVPATECPRIKASFLEEERRSLGSRAFRQEYMCEFAEADDAVFTREMIERAFCNDIEPLF